MKFYQSWIVPWVSQRHDNSSHPNSSNFALFFFSDRFAEPTKYVRYKLDSHRIHVWYIYLHLPNKNQPNVGEYTIHGSYGTEDLQTKNCHCNNHLDKVQVNSTSPNVDLSCFQNDKHHPTQNQPNSKMQVLEMRERQMYRNKNISKIKRQLL